MDDKRPRDRLLDAAIDYVAENGIGELSLGVAAALGTSHRMLIHHFGSKEGLWIAIVHTVEARQREMLGELLPDPDKPIREAMWTWWKHISDPSLWPNERLFFELYGQALQGRGTRPSSSTGSSRAGSSRRRRSTWPAGFPASSPGLTPAPESQSRGDCCWTCWRPAMWRGVDAAMDAFIDLYEAWVERAAQLAAQASQ